MSVGPGDGDGGGRGAAGARAHAGPVLQGGLEADLLEVRGRRRWERPALGRQRLVGSGAEGRPSGHVLPGAGQHVVGGGGRRGAAVCRTRLLAAEAPLAELGGHERAAALGVVGGAARRLRFCDELRLTRVGLPQREHVPPLAGERLRLRFVLGEVARARGRFDRLVAFRELWIHVDDVVSGARREHGRRAPALGVGLGAGVGVLLALVGDLPLGARVERRARGRRRLGPQPRHRQLEASTRDCGRGGRYWLS